MAGAAPLPMRRHRFQDFSLPMQPRDRSKPLAEILREEGIGSGSRVGLFGWKAYADPGIATCRPTSSTSSARSSGAGGSVENATDLFIDPADGLRVVNEVEQLAAFEWASCHTSQGVRSLLRGIRPGMSEREAVALLGWNGWPLSCHLMLTAGPHATFGLLSPGDRPIERGDPFTTAFGIWGALTCRAGFVVEDADELPDAIRDYVDRLVGPYFAAIGAWYAALRIGQTGGALQAIIDEHLGDPFFGIFLNPGHQIHLDEWVVTDLPRLHRRASVGHGPPGRMSSRQPAPSTSRPTSRTESSSPTMRCGASSRGATPTCGPASSGDGPSCRPRSASTCIPTSSRSRISRRCCLPSCCGRTARCRSPDDQTP